MTDREERPSVPGRIMVAEQTYERLKAQVIDQVIAPGARLSIDGLARELGVSQTPVRESLARLESDGLAVKTPLRGYRAAPLLTPEEFEDLYQFRCLIEPRAARRAATRIDRAAARSLQEEMASVTPPDSVTPPEESGYQAYRALAAHDERFHDLVARLSGSHYLRQALERTHCHLHIFRLRWDRSFVPETLAEHRRIAEAIAACTPDEAEHAMTAHLDAGLRGRLKGFYAPQ